MIKIFIDGQIGATGLALEERLLELAKTINIKFLKLADDLRKDASQRRKLLNYADVVFLCLPDKIARQSVAMIDNANTIVIDASTAYRTNPEWVYGFPELSAEQFKLITTANRIAVPGCHATGFIALVYPLIKSGIIQTTDRLYCHSITGYSGGGKQMIADYESEGAIPSAAWMYALDLNHKHLPEMKHWTGLVHNPLFIPVVVPIYKGMIVQIPLMRSANELYKQLKDYYERSKTIKVFYNKMQNDLHIENDISAEELEIYVFGNDKQAVLATRLDNLGKGSSGAALQCMKVRLGL